MGVLQDEIRMKDQQQDHEKDACLTCPNLIDRDELGRMIRETHLAVVGNPRLGVTGLVSRMEHVEEKQRKITLQAVGFGGVVAGAVVGLKGIITALIGK
jgi:hypothetical protein